MKKVFAIIGLMMMLVSMNAAEYRLRDSTQTKIEKCTEQALVDSQYKLFVNYIVYGTQEKDLEVQPVRHPTTGKLGFYQRVVKNGKELHVEIYPDDVERVVLLQRFDKELNKFKEQAHQNWK